jgi:hypothetical protein
LALSAENRRKAVLLRFVAPFRLTTFGTLPEGQAQGVFSLDIYLKFK